MEIYLDDCNSLPEQVEINKCNIKKIMQYLPLHGFWKKNVTLYMQSDNHTWHYDDETNLYVYYITDSRVNEDTVAMITPVSDKVLTPLFIDSYLKIRGVNSYNGGVRIYAYGTPSIDLQCTLYFNSNVTNLD